MPLKPQTRYPKAQLLRIFALLFLATQSLYAQTIPTAPNQRNTEGKRIGEWVITYTKNWKETSTTDSIAFYRKIAFDNIGKPQGKTIAYYSSGKVRNEGILIALDPEEIYDGLVISYHENGLKRRETNYANGKANGFFKSWYESGVLEYEANYVNDKVEGIVKQYYKNGNLKVQWIYKNGKKNGNCKLYAENGNITDELLNIDDKLNGISKEWYGNGILKSESSYVNDTLNGIFKKWYESGKPQGMGLYKKGKLEGIVKQWSEKGDSSIYYYENGNWINWKKIYQEASELLLKNKYVEATPLFEESFRVFKMILSKDNPNYEKFLSVLTYVYFEQSQFSKVEPFMLEIVDVYRKRNDTLSIKFADELNRLGVVYIGRGQRERAIEYLFKSLKIQEQQDSVQSPLYARTLLNIAYQYSHNGFHEKALIYNLRGLEINQKVLKEDHSDLLSNLNNLASIYEALGDLRKAEYYFLRNLEISRKKGDNEQNAMSLGNLGELYEGQGLYEKAEAYYLKASEIFKKMFGESNEKYAICLGNLGDIYVKNEQYTKAEETLYKVLEIYKQNKVEDSLHYSSNFAKLSYLYLEQKKYDKAEYYQIRALNINKSFGEEHPVYASSLNNLAELYQKQGLFDKALPLYQKALAIQKKTLNEQHPTYSTTLYNLGGLYAKQGQYKKAETILSQSFQIKTNNLLMFLETAHQAQQEAYIRTREEVFNFGYSFGLLAKTPTSAKSAYESALLMKGIQLQNTTQLLNYVRQSKDTLLLSQHEQWLALKRSINAQNNQPIAKRVGVAVMQEQADSLYKIMARRSVAFRNFKALFQITPQSIQKQLKTQEAAIEFVHFQYHNGKRWTDSTYYAALVLRKDWAGPRMVYLCEQRALDSLLSLKGNEPRNSQYVERIYGYGNRGIGTDKEKPLRSLYTLLWQPIDSLLTGVSTVYYSPSGLLNRINMAAIATPTPRQRLLDKYAQLVQLRSTREIVMPQEPITYTQQALLMGGIEYNLDSLAYRRVNAGYKQNRGDNSISLPNSRGGIYSSLPATNVEISSVQTLMQAQQWRVDTLKDLRASEEAFQFYATQKPRVIHLATHGFFLEDTLTRRKRGENLSFDQEPNLLTSSDPMQRSGLILAGGNHAWQGKTPMPNQADGLLTASEIGAMVLNNTELAVLSACETGLGDVKGSEGVFGLQRAFKMAGVKYLLMSLWSVNDEITNLFMQQFYENWLTNKTSIREAYQSTVKQFRKSNPEPYNWAAFVLLE